MLDSLIWHMIMILQERIVLAQIFYDTSMNSDNPTWLTTGDHCTWAGVTCNADKQVTSLVLEDLSLTGTYPSTLNKLSALASLTTNGNKLTTNMSNDICSMPGIQIVADETNCPNNVGTSGCCAAVRLVEPSPYLYMFTNGHADCDSASPSFESGVCSFMKSNSNHADVFTTYPDGFPYDAWLEVSI
jgi:hypothetical protein